MCMCLSSEYCGKWKRIQKSWILHTEKYTSISSHDLEETERSLSCERKKIKSKHWLEKLLRKAGRVKSTSKCAMYSEAGVIRCHPSVGLCCTCGGAPFWCPGRKSQYLWLHRDGTSLHSFPGTYLYRFVAEDFYCPTLQYGSVKQKVKYSTW